MFKMVDAMEVDVVVIGAGISGLSAAKILKEKKLKVLVLEAKDKVGGRMKTIKNHEFGYIDLGAAYIGPTQKNILRLCNELGLSLYTVNEKEKTVMNWKGKWAVYDGMIPPVWNPIKLLDLNHIQRSLNMMAKQVPTSWPWTADKAAEWDSLTVQHYLDKTCWTKFSKDLVTLLVRTTLTAEPYEVSLLFLLWYINCGGGIESLCSITNGAQEKKIVGGSKQVCEKLAEKLEGKIKLSTPVVAIEQQKDVAIVTDLHGKKYKAKFIISAIPQTFLNRIAFHPPLPAVKQQLIQRMPMGAVIKTVMYYPTAFWRKFGLNGSSMTNFGPIAYTIDDTRPNEEYPAIMGFIDADKAREMSEMTKEERKNIIKEYYAEAFRSHQFFNPIGYAEKNWMGEDYLGGVFYMPPGALSKYGSMLRKPIGRVHFAGTETATQWVGYMDGAVQAGERAAREVLFNFGIIDRSKIWWQDNQNISCSPGNYGPSWIEWILPSITRLLQTIGAFLLGFTIYEYYPMFTGWRAVMLYKLYQFMDTD